MKNTIHICFTDRAKEDRCGVEMKLRVDLSHATTKNEIYRAVANALIDYIGYVPSNREFVITNYDECSVAA